MTPVNQFFKTCAIEHKYLKHEGDEPDELNVKRNAFFISRDAQLFTITHSASYPNLVLFPYFGQLVHDSSVDDLRTTAFEVRDRLTDVNDADDIDLKEELCRQIGMDIIKQINFSFEKEGNSGPFPAFDINTVRYDFIGIVDNAQVGCRFTFQYRQQAFNKYKPFTDEFIPVTP